DQQSRCPGCPQVREAPDPQATPGEVRVRVRASGINFSELMARMACWLLPRPAQDRSVLRNHQLVSAAKRRH
ncbi:MAG TPA: hypothetical protein VIK01_03030, partial [Polyangiaceae bacterium]